MFGPNNSLAFVLKLGLESGKDSVTVKTVTVKNFMKFHAAKFIPERKLEYYYFKHDLNPKIKVGTRSRPDIITR